MQNLSGYTQNELDEIYKAFGTSKEHPESYKIILDNGEEAMSINFPIPPGGQLIVSRKAGANIWQEVPGEYIKSDFE
jgi:hypothetical protein